MKHQIDLSDLTLAEQAQFADNADVLTTGDTPVAIYMRYSSDRQTEQSIEGQLRDLISYCKLHAYQIYDVYVDRAASAAKNIEKRTRFLEMIADSDKHNWKYVLVWKLDRFARNRNDSAIYKMRLKKNGVRVLSATENISENPEGIILESVLEGMAEFYSAELSQKITRGMRESALKAQSLGGHVPLGYKTVNKQFVVDPDTAPIVQLAFELYSEGWSVADICREFNTRGYRSSKGSLFNCNSFKTILRNKKYIGVYSFDDIEIEDSIPLIVSKELFYKVQRRLRAVGDAPARGKAKVDYLLSGKLFCGHCGNQMNGDCGKGKSGKRYHYYTCYGKKKLKRCDKKNLPKEWIEDIVVTEAFAILTPENIEKIAEIAVLQSEEDIAKNTRLPALSSQLKTVENSIVNIINAIEKGVASDTLMSRLSELEKEKKNLTYEISEEQKGIFRLDKDQVVWWLSQFLNKEITNEDVQRQLIDLLVNSVTVTDLPDGDKFEITISYNLTPQKTKSVFGLEFDGSTITPVSELTVVGTLVLQTKIHSLP